MHFLNDLLHQLHGTERACHNPGSETRQIISVKVRLLHFGDEHGRNTIDRRASLAVNDLQNLMRIKVLQRDQRSSVSIGAEDSNHAAEAMEQGHRQAETVRRCITQAIGKRGTIVQNVTMAQHYSLWKTCGARGVLHVYDIVEIKRFLTAAQFIDGHGAGES